MNALKRFFGFFPTPFWVYFFSMTAGILNLVPQQAAIFDLIIRHILPLSLFLMLIGSPVTDLIKMGRPALIALCIGTATIFIGQVVSYVLFMKTLPENAWQAVGALMGTWIGGSANMVAVKEILRLPDSDLGPLIIVDTFLSYGWMALLLFAARFQNRFAMPDPSPTAESTASEPGNVQSRLVTLTTAVACAEASIWAGRSLNPFFPALSAGAWSLLLVSTFSILLASAALKPLKNAHASSLGTYLLYLVLASIGVKTKLGASLQAPAYLLYGLVAFAIHGTLSYFFARFLKIPLFLLATASQANIGGAVSAPIVAEAYRPNTAPIGVLMAVAGAVMGTYLGVAGGYLCRALASFVP